MLNLKFDPFPELITERLVLRPLTRADAHEIFLLRSDDNVNKFIDRPKAVTIDEATQFIDKIIKIISNNESLYWAINLKNDPRLIGTICYWNIIEDKLSGEIGYELHPDFQGKGIMQEAVERVINFGFKNMQLAMIMASLHPDNQPSIKLLERNHFSRNEKLEQEMNHETESCLVYTLSR